MSEIEITDIKKGIGVFTPKPDKPVSFASLSNNLKQAGYTLASADLTVSGKLLNESGKWFLIAGGSGQRFALEGNTAAATAGKLESGASVERRMISDPPI